MNKKGYELNSKKDDDENYSYLKSMLFDFNPENSVDVNNMIDQMHIIFEKLSIQFQKEALNLIRINFLDILNNKNSEEIINSLNSNNRKFFEKIIICENIEEYLLLNNVYETKKHNTLFEKNIISLEEEYENNKSINECLLSSNSWKLTRYLRIKDLLHKHIL